jgi:hypothetical protein
VRIVGLVLRAVLQQLHRGRQQRQLLAFRESLRDVPDRSPAHPQAIEADGAVRQTRCRLVADRRPLHFLAERANGPERATSLLCIERQDEEINPKPQSPNPKSQPSHEYLQNRPT